MLSPASAQRFLGGLRIGEVLGQIRRVFGRDDRGRASLPAGSGPPAKSATSGRSAGRPGWPGFSPARPMSGSYLAGQASGPFAGSFEAVEDQVDPELVLIAVVVAGLEDVLDSELGEVRVLVSGEPRQHRLGQRRGFRWSVERPAALLQREPVDVSVEDRVGLRGQLDREASVPKAPDDGVVVPQRRGTWGG